MPVEQGPQPEGCAYTGKQKGHYMIKPDLKEILKLSKNYNVIPVYGETLADLETPLSAYMKIDDPEAP